jgi:hypothetical protein
MGMANTVFLKVAPDFHIKHKPFSVRCRDIATKLEFSSVDLNKFKNQLIETINTALTVMTGKAYVGGGRKKRCVSDLCTYLSFHYGIDSLVQYDAMLNSPCSDEDALSIFIKGAIPAQLLDVIEATVLTRYAASYAYETSHREGDLGKKRRCQDIAEKWCIQPLNAILEDSAIPYRVNAFKVVPIDAPLLRNLKISATMLFREQDWHNPEKEIQLAIKFLNEDPAKSIRESTKALESVMIIILQTKYGIEVKEKDRTYGSLLKHLDKAGFFKEIADNSSEAIFTHFEKGIIAKLNDIMKEVSPMRIRGPEEHGKGLNEHAPPSSYVAELLLNLSASYCWFLWRHCDFTG